MDAGQHHSSPSTQDDKNPVRMNPPQLSVFLLARNPDSFSPRIKKASGLRPTHRSSFGQSPLDRGRSGTADPSGIECVLLLDAIVLVAGHRHVLGEGPRTVPGGGPD